MIRSIYFFLEIQKDFYPKIAVNKQVRRTWNCMYGVILWKPFSLTDFNYWDRNRFYLSGFRLSCCSWWPQYISIDSAHLWIMNCLLGIFWNIDIFFFFSLGKTVWGEVWRLVHHVPASGQRASRKDAGSAAKSIEIM